jgi:hypothetical protein
MASCRDLAANPHSSPGAINLISAPANLLLPGTESDGALGFSTVGSDMATDSHVWEFLVSWPPWAVGRLYLSHVRTSTRSVLRPLA